MRTSTLLISLVAISWVAVTEALVAISAGVGALALGGLAVLKGAALLGLAGRGRRRSRGRGHQHQHHHHHHQPHHKPHHQHHHQPHYHGKRSIESPIQAEENMLLSTAEQLDPNGCIQKILCHLQVQDEASLTYEESILVDMFTNSTETITAFNSVFVGAVNIGAETQDVNTCAKNFPKCSLDGAQLRDLLKEVWGCGFNEPVVDYDDQNVA